MYSLAVDPVRREQFFVIKYSFGPREENEETLECEQGRKVLYVNEDEESELQLCQKPSRFYR